MVLFFNHNGNSYSFNTLEPIDISLPVMRGGIGVNCFYANKPSYLPYQAGSFIGNVAMGGACNVDLISFMPHGNGTHTECIGHINSDGQTIPDTLKEGFMLVSLITVLPDEIEGDHIISRHLIEARGVEEQTEAIIVRTLPNLESKRIHDYSGTNPAYFSWDALHFLREKGIKHLLCDIPSVDREDDGGKLLAHRSFFGVPESPRLDATITELVFVSENIPDGLYMLNLQIAPFQSDASPSRPLLYTIY